jgi:hypothetical protein
MDSGSYVPVILGLGAAVFATALVNAGYDLYHASRRGKMWKLFQFAVVIGVVVSNMQWPWIDGHIAAAVVGLIAAALPTLVIKSLLELLRLLFVRSASPADGVDE